MAPVEVLALGNRGSSLHVTLERNARHASWSTTTIAISAYPWQGTLDATFTDDDLHEWSTRLRGTTLLARSCSAGAAPPN
ncbi:hypothetical protein BJF78_34715 [Pseudonocardia sp. CNS-139]|nr:hypothetical protein BJF78_34715 [Pseudonocardia sp. CNS-139]